MAGYTGQLSLGHALFFGVGGYSAGLLNLNYGLPPQATIPLGALIAVVAGLIVGIPALRLRGPYLAIVTLAFPMILLGVILSTYDFSGGYIGLPGLTPLTESRVSAYYMSLLLMAVCVAIMWKLTDIKSRIVRTGLVFRAIREDEITARISGINTIRYKLLAFAISGFFGGLAGAFYVHYTKVVGPSSLDLLLSFQAIIWTIFGGLGTIHGAITGVFFLYPLSEFLRIIPEARLLIYFFLLIIVLLFMPEGLNIRILDRIQLICPRCKLTNAAIRRHCRACGAPLRSELKATEE